MSEGLSIRRFIVREADWATERSTLSNIRRIVFIVEQGVPQEQEWDGQDEKASHFIALSEDDTPIGNARLLPDGQIGRMAVISEHRGKGVGRVLLEAAVEKARHLGLPRVYLHAQTHALTFYERSGFIPFGEEFEEAGIAHREMALNLTPLADKVQRRTAVETSLDIGVKQFDTREVSWSDYRQRIRVIRRSVLVGELGLPDDFVEDPTDTDAIHWIAEDEQSGQAIGSIRMSVDGTASRLAVLPEHRGKGIGTSLLELTVSKGTRFALPLVAADALAALEPLYLGAGFEPRGDRFSAYDLPHQHYVHAVNPPDLDEVPRRQMTGDRFDNEAVIYRLGDDKKLILLRSEDDFHNIIIEMCRQATHSIRIFSPVLEHKLFDDAVLRDICSALARRNKYTHIEVLLFDSHRVVKNGHALLEIARRLPSSIQIRIVHPELRQQNHEFVLADSTGVIYRHDYEIYDGYANFSDVADANRLGRQFSRAWDSSLADPYLRTLKI